ncbi:MAG: CopD family protein [Gemmatimonadaceae bacterium]
MLDFLAAAARFVSLAAILLVTGESVFAVNLAGRLDPNESTTPQVLGRASRLRKWGLSLLAVALGCRLVLQAMSFTDAGEPVLPMMATVLTAMVWGRGWIGQSVILLACALPVSARARLMLVAILSATPAFMGHAVATERAPMIAVIADGLHVLGSGVWLGTLTVLIVAALPLVASSVALRLIRTFSPVALTAAATIAVTGSVSALLHLSSWRDLVTSGYGQLLLLKVLLVGVAALLGGYNWKRSTPALERGDASVLRRVSRMEVAAAVTILLVTSILIAMPFPGEG